MRGTSRAGEVGWPRLSIAAGLFAVSSISAHTPSYAATAIRAVDLNGTVFSLPAAASRATVLIFVLHDCPICNRYAPEINRIAADYKPSDVATYVVYEERDLRPSQARAHAKAYGLTCGLLYDPWHELANKVTATSAPEAVVLSPTGEVVYRGRIDDSFYHFGMLSRQPTTHDLRDAVDALLAGKEIAVSQTPVVGCSIPPD